MSGNYFERRWGWWLRKKRRTRFVLATWWLLPTVAIGIGVWATYTTMFKLPEDYSVLDRRGVRVAATFAGCTGGRDEKCRLRLPASSSSWDYGQNFGQFNGLDLGSPVEVVIDPKDPFRRYTAADVRERTNQGVGILFGFGIIMALAGSAAIPWLLRFCREMLKLADEREVRRC